MIRLYYSVVFAVNALFLLGSRAQNVAPGPMPRQMLLQHPEQIQITAQFETPFGRTSVDRAIKFVADEIEAKYAADAARSPIWHLAIWRYLPADPAFTLNSRVASDDDPFLTPTYLKVSARQLDYQLKKSEAMGQEFLR